MEEWKEVRAAFQPKPNLQTEKKPESLIPEGFGILADKVKVEKTKERFHDTISLVNRPNNLLSCCLQPLRPIFSMKPG